MVRFGLLVILMLGLARPAMAQSLIDCGKDEARVVTDALRNAKDLTLVAAARVGDTPEYRRWFGDYSDANAEVVRATLKSVITAIRSGGVSTECHRATDPSCSAGEYAWVYPHRPFEVHVCPPFFQLPPLTALRPGERRSDNGTREGTMVHEISHFLEVADTWDHCYSRSECSQMAIDYPRRAIENADSYQYFTEDVTYYARQPLAGKPATD
ncbi:M35 family metallo-endopeptidase [Cognatiyoonia sp. IB215182]|uniref:M35 family metallo-endopeptidase n=1 Tax=Cognatiyoonia sp. IB215182 TaxID=3097353 RepID=UPI002A164E59|nr:M35 family metallo-endopeptidase [Cognatiyoonia sp. IB215182]MDX8353545.1 M35 family metallo-endopeptidase [Cognatiyoonia sp. IB215182]